MNEAKFFKGRIWIVDWNSAVDRTNIGIIGKFVVRNIGRTVGTSDNTQGFKEREEYGICSVCGRYNTNYQWCQSCDPKLLAQSWTSSGNEKLDEIIRNTQLEAKGFDSYHYLEWIPYDQLIVIDAIGKGGFATVHSCFWSNGPRYVYNNKRYYCANGVVALKKFKNSQNTSDEFLKELQNHIKFIGPYHKGIVNIYGISQDPNTKEYVLIMRYAPEGDFKKYLESNDTTWSDKIKKLYDIISSLNTFHQEKLTHGDLHSGNILYFGYLSEAMITDLGLSGSIGQETSSGNGIIGVLPYIAPEVLNGKPYTQKSDIYSFGVLMSETSTHQQPFKDQPHDIYLALKICGGLRPSFSDNTPECYIKLAYKCMDADPEKRPTADEILKIITYWKDATAIDDDDGDEIINLNKSSYSKKQFDELEKLRKIFKKADEKPFNPSTISATVHQSAIYTSRLLNFTNLPQPVNSNKVTIISNNNESKQIELTMPDSTQIELTISDDL